MNTTRPIHRAAKREKFLRDAEALAVRAEQSEHHASARILARDEATALCGVMFKNNAEVFRSLAAFNLRQAHALTDWDEGQNHSPEWLQQLEAAAAEARKGEMSPGQVQTFMSNKSKEKHSR